MPEPRDANAAERQSRADPDNAFDTAEGYSGQEYHIDRERAEGARHPSGEVNAERDPASPPRQEGSADLPPENGRRAWFDSATGAVHGSGSGAGGGNPGEDFDSDSAAGDGYVPTGSGDEASPEDSAG